MVDKIEVRETTREVGRTERKERHVLMKVSEVYSELDGTGLGVPCRALDSDDLDRLFFSKSRKTPLEAEILCAMCPIAQKCYEMGISLKGTGVWGGRVLREGKDVTASPSSRKAA